MEHKEHIWSQDRRSYIPNWTPEFDAKAMERPVSDYRGKPMGFWVKDVLPERLWALNPETGQCIDQDRFEDMYIAYLVGFGNVTEADARFEHIPRVERFVNARRDFQSHIVPISYFDAKREKYDRYDPDQKSDETGDDGLRYDPKTQQIVLDKEVQARMDKLEVLSQLHDEGTLADADFAKKAGELVKSSDKEAVQNLQAAKEG